MIKSQLFMLMGLISTVFIMTLNVKLVQFYERDRSMKANRLIPKNQLTCPNVFEIEGKSKNMSEMMTIAVDTVAEKKNERGFLRQLYYEVMGFEGPSMILKKTTNDSIKGTNYTIKQRWRFSQSKGHFSHMPCRLREYGPKEVEMCVAQKLQSGTDKAHILYIGDSRIRQHIEVMIDLLRDLDLKITTYKGEILTIEDFLGERGSKQWSKYKHNFKVESLKVPKLLIEFNWAALIDWGDEPKNLVDNISFPRRFHTKWETDYKESKLNTTYSFNGIYQNETEKDYEESEEHPIVPPRQMLRHPSYRSTTKASEQSEKAKTRVGAYEILQRLNSSPQDHLPDIVFLNTGAWLLKEHYSTPLQAIDHCGIIPMQTLRPLLQKLAERTTVVWLAPDPFKEHVFHNFDPKGRFTYETNAILEWVLNAQAQLKPPGVLFWDTFLPVSYASSQDCMYLSSESANFTTMPKYKMFEPLLTWGCMERIHVGFEVLSVATHMALNELCNPYLEGQYCCSNANS